MCKIIDKIDMFIYLFFIIETFVDENKIRLNIFN